MSPFVSVRFLQTQSDARLLMLARKGHERAFEALVHRYRRQLLAHCRRLLGSEGRAEDGLQQGLMQAWIALQRDTDVREVRPWLYRVVHNASLNLLRARADTIVLEDDFEAAVAPEGDIDRRMEIREALAGVAALPQLQREALLRTAVDGHSHEQVASALGLSDGAVRGLVYRARVTLRAGVTAVTPGPLATWAAAARPSAPLAQRLAELAGGGGSAGIAAVLVKGGAAVVTAGAVVAGVAAPVAHLAGGSAPPSAAGAATTRPGGASGQGSVTRSVSRGTAIVPASSRAGSSSGSRRRGPQGRGAHGLGRGDASLIGGRSGRGDASRGDGGGSGSGGDGGSSGSSDGGSGVVREASGGGSDGSGSGTVSTGGAAATSGSSDGSGSGGGSGSSGGGSTTTTTMSGSGDGVSGSGDTTPSISGGGGSTSGSSGGGLAELSGSGSPSGSSGSGDTTSTSAP
jgi:RNA polymerase sigma factor (sigma-70 family)